MTKYYVCMIFVCITLFALTSCANKQDGLRHDLTPHTWQWYNVCTCAPEKLPDKDECDKSKVEFCQGRISPDSPDHIDECVKRINNLKNTHEMCIGGKI